MKAASMACPSAGRQLPRVSGRCVRRHQERDVASEHGNPAGHAPCRTRRSAVDVRAHVHPHRHQRRNRVELHIFDVATRRGLYHREKQLVVAHRQFAAGRVEADGVDVGLQLADAANLLIVLQIPDSQLLLFERAAVNVVVGYADVHIVVVGRAGSQPGHKGHGGCDCGKSLLSHWR